MTLIALVHRYATAAPVMKLSRIGNDQIVVISHGRHFAIAEAHEMKQAGFGQRQVAQVMPGEWSLQASSFLDFQRLAAVIPVGYVVTPLSAKKRK